MQASGKRMKRPAELSAALPPDPTLAGDLQRQDVPGAAESLRLPRRRKFPLGVNGYTGAFGATSSSSKTLLGA